jgi:hypothetical protein
MRTPFSYSYRRLLIAATFLGTSAVASAVNLSTIIENPWWLQFRVQLFYVGAATPFYEGYHMGGAGINLGYVQNRPFFARVTSVSTWRTDQSRAVTFLNTSQTGVWRIKPGNAYLSPTLMSNLRYW